MTSPLRPLRENDQSWHERLGTLWPPGGARYLPPSGSVA